MTLLSRFTSRKGMHTFEWIVVFAAVATSIILMSTLTKGYWNARMQVNDESLHQSFYDTFPEGQMEEPGPCQCTDWVLLNACGVGDCGACQKIAFRGCSPLGCDETQKCFTPGESVPDCPDCAGADPCSGITDELECWSDQPTPELIEIVGPDIPCALGEMITMEIVCENCGDPDNCPFVITCNADPLCQFECQEITETLIGFWYFPCNDPNDPEDDPQNGNTDATFVESGGCSGAPCEFQCPGGFDVNAPGSPNNTYYGNVPPSNVCECPNDGGYPTPYTVEIDPETGLPTCVCQEVPFACVGDLTAYCNSLGAQCGSNTQYCTWNTGPGGVITCEHMPQDTSCEDNDVENCPGFCEVQMTSGDCDGTPPEEEGCCINTCFITIDESTGGTLCNGPQVCQQSSNCGQDLCEGTTQGTCGYPCLWSDPCETGSCVSTDVCGGLVGNQCQLPCEPCSNSPNSNCCGLACQSQFTPAACESLNLWGVPICEWI